MKLKAIAAAVATFAMMIVFFVVGGNTPAAPAPTVADFQAYVHCMDFYHNEQACYDDVYTSWH